MPWRKNTFHDVESGLLCLGSKQVNCLNTPIVRKSAVNPYGWLRGFFIIFTHSTGYGVRPASGLSVGVGGLEDLSLTVTLDGKPNITSCLWPKDNKYPSWSSCHAFYSNLLFQMYVLEDIDPPVSPSKKTSRELAGTLRNLKKVEQALQTLERSETDLWFHFKAKQRKEACYNYKYDYYKWKCDRYYCW